MAVYVCKTCGGRTTRQPFKASYVRDWVCMKCNPRRPGGDVFSAIAVSQTETVFIKEARPKLFDDD